MVKEKRIQNIFRTGVVNMFFQFVFLIIMFVTGAQVALNIDQGLRFIVLAAIVLIPSVIWALFFYLQDRLEAEPAPYLLIAFIAGMTAAGLAAVPLYHIIFRVSEWMYASSLLFASGSFFVKASVASFLIYIIIRYGFYRLKEFDEPVDGMVYGAIAGTGFAFVESLHYLWLNPSYTLFVIAYTATANILIYSGVASIIGYFIGSAKFQRKNVDIYSVIAIGVGIILLGIYYLINEFIFISGFEHAFWFSFILTLVYSFLILLFCYLRMRTLTAKDYHEQIPVVPKFDSITVSFVVVLLIVASIISGQGLKGKKFVDTKYDISFYYSHSISPFALSDISRPLILFDKKSEIIFFGEHGSAPHFSLLVMVHQDKIADNNENLIEFVDVSNTENLLIKDIKIAGKQGKRLAYTYIEKGSSIKQEFPQLIKVYADIISTKQITFIFTYIASSEYFIEGLSHYTNMLNSIKWSAE